jgi:hypothetical protein
MSAVADPQSPVPEFLKSISGAQVAELARYVTGLVESAISKSLPSACDNALQQLGYTQEVAGLVHLLAARSNDSKENVLEKALTLYGLALDALEKGNRLAVLSPDDEIVHEIEGFEPVTAGAR